MLRATGVKRVTINKLVPGQGIGDSKVESDNKEISNQTGPKKFSKKFRKINFLIFKAKLVFFWLKQAFTKILILYHFILKPHIYMKKDTSGYLISKLFS